MAGINFQNNFATNPTANTAAAETNVVITDNPTVDPPYYLALDATNLNSHYEVILVTADDGSGTLTHAATTYAHTTAEEVRMVCPAVHLNTMQEFPEGTMINGKITPTVASNNLTVALKTKAGADPSVTDPVYVMIGGTMRSITSAVTWTRVSGDSIMKMGGSELATKEVDLFTYLIWDATNSVFRIGWARIPYGNLYSDFSGTYSEEKFLDYTANTGLVATDVCVNIGRFAATQSAGAGYTWTVPTFTASNLIQRPIYETRWLDWTPTISFTGGAAPTTPNAVYTLNGYKIIGSAVDACLYRVYGSAGTTVTQVDSTLPITPAANGLTASLYTACGRTNPITTSQSFADSSDNKFKLQCSALSMAEFGVNGVYEI